MKRDSRKTRRRRRNRGQGSTELLLVIAVVVIGVASAAYTFVPLLHRGVEDLAADVQRLLKTQRVTISMDLLNHTAHDEQPTAGVELDDPLFEWKVKEKAFLDRPTQLVDHDPPGRALVCTERGNC